MISLHNILSIAKYERKTLLRSWFFRIFSILSLLVLFGMNFGMVIEGSGSEGWAIRAIPSAIPYFNLLILNVAQAIIAVFLASDFLKRDKKLDTTEVIYMRSMTNGEYIFGKTWGNLQVFLVLNVVVVALALVFNLLAQDTAVNWEAYGIYLVLISVPTLIFIMGLSFLLMSIIRNQAITFVLILGYIGITLFLLQAKYYYIFDYMSFNIPMLKSDIVGFGNISAILAHRGIYLSLGIGFISFTIFMLKRLPQSEGTTIFSLIFSIVFITIGVYLGYSHIHNFKKVENVRAQAVELNNKYVKENFPATGKISLSLEHKGETIAVKSAMVLKNNSGIEIKKLILSLNNGLKVTRLKIEGKEVPFIREHQLIIVNDQAEIQPGDEINVEIDYEGTIDEAFCYLDIDEKTFQEKYGKFVINVDKRYAFVTPNYVLLTPESNWYPRTGVTFSSENVGWNRPEFINFSLDVKTAPSLKAVSQGKIVDNMDGHFIFENDHALTQISLSIGDYEIYKVERKGIEFGMWVFKGHDYFSEFFDEVKDTIPNVIGERLEDFERTYNLVYSSKRLSIVEVPAQFKTYERIWTSSQELVQPEQIFIPEKGFMLRDADFKNQMKREQKYGHDNENLSPQELKIRGLINFLGSFTREQGRPDFQRSAGGNFTVSETVSPYFIFALLYKFQNNITSTQWPITNRIFEAYLKNQTQDMRSTFMRNVTGMSEDEMANIALQDSTFVEILANTAQKGIIDNVIKLKGDVLFSMIQWKAGETEFSDYLRKILTEYKFTNMTFEEFDKGLLAEFGIELTPIMEDWFNEKTLPGYIFSPISAVKVKMNDMIRTMVSFKATNFSDTEGVIKISLRLGSFGGRGGGGGGSRGGGGGGGSRGGGGFSADNSINKILYLGAHQTKQVSYLLDIDPRMVTLNTMTSKNIPQVITQGFSDIKEDLKLTPFEGEIILDKPVSIALPNETIVDNEDPGFEVTKIESKSLLQKWILKDNVNASKYEGYNTWHPPTNWTLTTNSDFFGEYIRSGYYIKSGDGSLKAKWNVPIKDPASYDVYYYLYKSRDFRRGGDGDNPKGEYHFTIHHDDGEEEVSFEYSNAVDGWNHLGSFYFSPDTALIELSNKSELRTLNADAVKLVKL